jgi:uncharacterized DUF497 family protein
MSTYEWNEEKNIELLKTRGVTFEEVVAAFDQGRLVGIEKHSNPAKYPHQKMYIVCMNDYVYSVPFVESEDIIFLKTIIPSRKFKKKYHAS